VINVVWRMNKRCYATSGPVSTGMGDRDCGQVFRCVTSLFSLLSGVAKLGTYFGWDKGGNVTSAGWQVTLRDPIWHVSSRSEQTAIFRTFTF